MPSQGIAERSLMFNETHRDFLISQFILSGGYFVLIISKVYMNITFQLLLEI